jgi:hypothetical protein
MAPYLIVISLVVIQLPRAICSHTVLAILFHFIIPKSAPQPVLSPHFTPLTSVTQEKVWKFKIQTGYLNCPLRRDSMGAYVSDLEYCVTTKSSNIINFTK